MSETAKKTTHIEAEHFFFLDRLRESGVTNMLGAAPYVEREFSVDKATSKRILSAWMETFGDGSKPPEERVKMVQ